MFRAQLLREDVARLRKLQALAREAADAPAFMQAGTRLAWAADAARAQELREPLERLLAAVYAFEKENGPEARVAECWRELWRVRMERMVGCLSTPLPRPAD